MIQALVTTHASAEMSSPLYSPCYLTNDKGEHGSTRRSQDCPDFSNNPFQSLKSTTAFLGLCVFVVTSIYILLQKYRRARNYKSFSSAARLLPTIESARALSSGIDSGQSLRWSAESELATADLIDIREGPISDDGEVSPIGMLPYVDTESEEEHTTDYDLESAIGGRTLQQENEQDRYFTPMSESFNNSEVLWAKQKQAGEELDLVRWSLRNRTPRPNAVVVGLVGDGGIVQRRTTASNRSM